MRVGAGFDAGDVRAATAGRAAARRRTSSPPVSGRPAVAHGHRARCWCVPRSGVVVPVGQLGDHQPSPGAVIYRAAEEVVAQRTRGISAGGEQVREAKGKFGRIDRGFW